MCRMLSTIIHVKIIKTQKLFDIWYGDWLIIAALPFMVVKQPMGYKNQTGERDWNTLIEQSLRGIQKG